MSASDFEIAIIGAGMAGLATAYYLSRQKRRSIGVIDCRQPMGFTSAQSGDNYRNWWPHRIMTAFTNHSIDLMEEIAEQSGNVLQMTRRGYALATRQQNIDALIQELSAGTDPANRNLIRHHESAGTAKTYSPPVSPDWERAPDGVDILSDRRLIQRVFPSFDPEIAHVLHIRRAGDIAGQQLGQYMLEQVRERGGRVVRGEVRAIDCTSNYRLTIDDAGECSELRADVFVNAAGPFAAKIAALLDVQLPIVNVLQQKIAFPDSRRAIPRQMPFAADLDGRTLDWTEEERELLRTDESTARLARHVPGAIHCRPDGGDGSDWLKLGWALNETSGDPDWEPAFDPHFPEIVLRGAGGLNPSLKAYYGRLPSRTHHYGGYYTMTAENAPLIGPMGPDGAFLVGALSGFGTMAACAAGDLCSRWIDQRTLPDYADPLSLKRYDKSGLLEELKSAGKGLL